MSKQERLKRFFAHARDPDDWTKEYARMIAFVEREAGVIVTEEYSHSKLMMQAKHFGELRKEEWTTLGKMIGCIK